jgi:hypothetical protein
MQISRETRSQRSCASGLSTQITNSEREEEKNKKK